MDVLSSTPVTLWADFEAPEGLEIPDVGSVSFSLYDGAGTPLAVNQALTPAAEATGVSIPILALHQVIAPPRAFERRQLFVTWTAHGRSRTVSQGYRVVPPAAYAARARDVRAYLALGTDELPDEEVDLFSAWLALRSVLTVAVLDAALASGTVSELRAERAIVLTAAVALFPSLRYRIAQAKTDGTLKFERIKDAKAFDGLVAATLDELMAISNGLAGVDVTNNLAPALILLGTNTTDPVTGAPPVAVGA